MHDADLVRVVERLGRLDAQRGGRSEELAAAGGRAEPVDRAESGVAAIGDLGRRFGGVGRPAPTGAAVSAGSGDPPRDRRVGGFSGAETAPSGGRRRLLHSPSFGDRLGQGLPLDELHGVVVDAALAADRINRDDVGVVELGGGQGLGLEPPELGRVHGRREREHLQRHPAVQRTLHRLVHHPHAPAAHLGDQAEVAQVADPGLAFTRFDRLRIGDQRRRGQRRLADEFEAGQARLQVLGQLGMFGQQLVPRGRGALLGGGQVGVQDLDQPDLARRFGSCFE